jgi:hypothetical protein
MSPAAVRSRVWTDWFVCATLPGAQAESIRSSRALGIESTLRLMLLVEQAVC